MCETSGQPISVQEAEGYIASIVTRETGAGSTHCPWIIRVASGQRINVTLYDFDVTPASIRGDKCHVYAVIRDVRLSKKSSTSEVTVCGGGDKRAKSVFLSESNAIEIEIMSGGLTDTVPYFLLHYTGLYIFTVARILANIYCVDD